MDATGDAFNELVSAVSVFAKTILQEKILPLVGAVVVVIIIWAGIKYITGGTRGEETAKKTLIAVFTGIIIIVLAYWIIQYTSDLLQPSSDIFSSPGTISSTPLVH